MNFGSLLLQPPKCYDYARVPLNPIYTVLGIEPRALCMTRTYSVNRVPSSALKMFFPFLGINDLPPVASLPPVLSQLLSPAQHPCFVIGTLPLPCVFLSSAFDSMDQAPSATLLALL